MMSEGEKVIEWGGVYLIPYQDGKVQFETENFISKIKAVYLG